MGTNNNNTNGGEEEDDEDDRTRDGDSNDVQPNEPNTIPLPEPASDAPPVWADRYLDHGLIGAGAMGVVRRVYDNHLERFVAMKITPATGREAPTLAALQHPAIVPIHDAGALEDGRAWFTMPLVAGRTLTEVLRTTHEHDLSPPNLRRLVGIVQTVAQAAAHAHQMGWVHRDLKPSNIMLGALGEVQVLDWGIAAAIGSRFVQVKGTPGFMSPEQAEPPGEVHGSLDVYALGALLYHALTGRPPYGGRSLDVLSALRERGPVPIEDVVPGRPDALVRTCQSAMTRDPTQRPTAHQFASALESWGAGEDRSEQAADMVEAARPAAATALHHATAARATEDEAAAALDALPREARASQKRRAWALLDIASEHEDRATLARIDAEQRLRAALEVCPDHPAAHRALADLARDQLDQAEDSGDRRAALRHASFLRLHDRGEHAAWLRGEAAVRLVTEPPGAEVEVSQVVVRDRRWVPDEGRVMGRTPCTLQLPVGSYRVTLRLAGRAPTVLPLRVRRGRDWDAGPHPIFLPPAELVGPGVAYVPAGWTTVGGDPDALDAVRATRVWIDGFLIQQHPVTHAQYVRFLDSIPLAQAKQLVPRHANSDIDDRDAFSVIHHDGGAWRLGATSDGTPIDPDWPVGLIDWWGACAYARWWSGVTGREWRLPHDLEWEKAARGTDGRVYPWGDHLEPEWTCMQESHHSGNFSRVAVHTLRWDVSPYDVRGLAGNVREWCLNEYRRLGPKTGSTVIVMPPSADEATFRVCRGGSWTSAARMCRSACRFASFPKRRLAGLGFRLVSPLNRG